ncbi:MAG TPA: (2Fe-2S)-binding protein [Clostridia bacterium]|nr:(2Fe-2S)-binding protein [Clostridia bacterium]
MNMAKIEFSVNGERVSLDVPAQARLVDVLRETLGLTGTKEGCGVGECGACTVIVNGKAVCSCITLAAGLNGADVITIEGVSQNGELDEIQQAILDHHALQCGFCTPGIVMSAKALLDANPNPTTEEIQQAIAGNLCRCTGYQQVIDAIADAAERRMTEE